MIKQKDCFNVNKPLKNTAALTSWRAPRKNLTTIKPEVKMCKKQNQHFQAFQEFKINKQASRDDVIAEVADPGPKLVVVIKWVKTQKQAWERWLMAVEKTSKLYQFSQKCLFSWVLSNLLLSVRLFKIIVGTKQHGQWLSHKNYGRKNNGLKVFDSEGSSWKMC